MIVIDKGEIVEQGRHEELLRHNGVYKKLVLRQLTAGAVTETLVNGDVEQNTDVEDKDENLIDLSKDNDDLFE